MIQLLTTKTGCTFFASNYSLVIPRPNRKDYCTYGINLLGTLKYDRIDIQSKVFDGATCIPTLYRLLKIQPRLPEVVLSQTW